MIFCAQAEVGITPWSTPGNRSARELLSPGVTSRTHCGAVLESNEPDMISVGTLLLTGRVSAVFERAGRPQASHSRKIQLPVGVIRSTESGRPGIANFAWDRACSGVVQFAISWQYAPSANPAPRSPRSGPDGAAAAIPAPARAPAPRERVKIIRGMSTALAGSAL